MNHEQPNNPLHGLTFEKILVRLQEHYGWEGLDAEIQINCFYNHPSIKSSLKFCVVLSGQETRLKHCISRHFSNKKLHNKAFKSDSQRLAFSFQGWV